MLTPDEKPSIISVLEHYGADLSHIPEGAGWMPLACPFHDDSTASAGVNLATGKFRCHKCPEYHGDSIDIIQEAEGLGSFRDALEWARDKLGYEGGSVRKAARAEQYRPSWEAEGD